MRACALISILIAGTLAASCSTTRVLEDGQYRLVRNRVRVEGSRKFNERELARYVKQQPSGWSPFLYVYNWGGKKDNGWGRTMRKLGVAPVVYDPLQVEPSARNIVSHLEYTGWYHSSVRTSVQLRGRRVTVQYLVQPGRRIPVASVSYDLPQRGGIAADFMDQEPSVTLRPGTFLSEQALGEETARCVSELRNRGYYGVTQNHFSFEADTLSVRDSARMTMRLQEYVRGTSPEEAQTLCKYRFGDVSISYPKSLKFREKTLRNLNTVRPGALYSERAVSNTYERLSALQVFNSVNVELGAADSASVDCRISLSAAKTQGFKVNLEASTNSSGLLGISPQLSYFHKNLFHGGERLNVSLMGNFQFKPGDDIRSTEAGISAGLSFPRFLLLPYRLFRGPVPRTDINASYNYQSRPEYTRHIISTSYGYNGRHRRLYYQAYPLQVNIVRLVNLDAAFSETLSDNPFLMNSYQNHFDLGMGAVFYYTNTTDVVPKTDYMFRRLQVDLAGNLLSLFNPLMPVSDGAHMIWNTPYSQYVRGEISGGRAVRFGRRDGMALAWRLLAGAGLAYGNASTLPFEKHFYAGGANSLRGWQARDVGPGCAHSEGSFVIPNQTGDMKLEANLEWRFPMFWKFEGALFTDAGNVWTLQGKKADAGRFRLRHFYRELAWDWGAGLRLNLNFILVRIDMGLKVYDPGATLWRGPADWFVRDGFALHFGVGYPF